MNDDLRKRIILYVIDTVEGGVCTSIPDLIDEAIQEGWMTAEEVRANERDIMSLIDDHIFECTCCGWTLPISEMGEDADTGLACEGCSPLEGDEDE